MLKVIINLFKFIIVAKLSLFLIILIILKVNKKHFFPLVMVILIKLKFFIFTLNRFQQ